MPRPYPLSLCPGLYCLRPYASMQRSIFSGSDMEYVRIIKELEEIREERLFVAEVFRDFELQNAIEEHEREKAMTLEELEVSGWLWKGGIQ